MRAASTRSAQFCEEPLRFSEVFIFDETHFPIYNWELIDLLRTSVDASLQEFRRFGSMASKLEKELREMKQRVGVSHCYGTPKPESCELGSTIHSRIDARVAC